jgi:DNA modification methylase
MLHSVHSAFEISSMKALAGAKNNSDTSANVLPIFRPDLTPSTRVAKEAYAAVRAVLEDIPQSDNIPGAVEQMLRANGLMRNLPWPPPYDETRHELHLGDARSLSWIPDGSVHLVVTSPPYWTLKEYEHSAQQLGDVDDYEAFLRELDKVWSECVRVLAPGGRICCVVGDVCVPRKRLGRHFVMPLHADIQVRSRRVGLDCLTPILWQKIANGATEALGNGAGFYGKPYQPGAIIKNDVEYVLFMRKGGNYRSPDSLQRVLSMLTKEEMQAWMRSSWSDIKGESTRRGHPAPFPVALAERLIRMFSFAGDIVLDPFSGTGTTAVAALRSGRNSISNELEPAYHAMAEARVREAAWLPMASGATMATVTIR